ncbi:MAG: polyphosphate polymerase domain-containing protein [Clostridia bacterium]|nr:polyphosphate polymerase domain-containing protein [Clostridia bacterium]
MKDTYIFRRVEKKYIIDKNVKDKLLEIISHRLIPDAYGKSTICSLYLDTPDYLLIRNSIDSTVYKEKLRVRSYGLPSADSKVFFEIKKKYKGVVYKRRVSMTYGEMCEYLARRVRPSEGQIMNEIDWVMKYYAYPEPRVLILYEREAYTCSENENVRLTFDTNVRYRTENLTPAGGDSGKNILPDDTVILEIKTPGGMPLWLSDALDKLKIYPSKCSKYGYAYSEIHDNMKKGKISNV